MNQHTTSEGTGIRSPYPFNPVRQGNAFEETIERLLQIIRLGVVPPGERLPSERELALQLGVSRATLREAISELEKAQWVEVRRGRSGGTFVSSNGPHAVGEQQGSEGGMLDAAAVEDTLIFRHVLEIGIVDVAAGNELSAERRRDLVRFQQECDNAGQDEYRRCDSRFHLALAESTGSASLVRAMAESRTRVNGLLDQIPMLTMNLQHANEQHQQIVTAIFSADVAAAREAMRHHLDATASLLRGFLS